MTQIPNDKISKNTRIILHLLLSLVHGGQYTCEKSTRTALIQWNRIKSYIRKHLEFPLWGSRNHIFRALNVSKAEKRNEISPISLRKFQLSSPSQRIIFLEKGEPFLQGRTSVANFPRYIREAILNRWKMHEDIQWSWRTSCHVHLSSPIHVQVNM